jgi:hypothetical protein
VVGQVAVTLFQIKARDFSLPQNVQIGCEPHPAFLSVGKGKGRPVTFCEGTKGRYRCSSILNDSTRRGWVIISTLLRLYPREGAQIRVVQQAEWSPGPVWTGMERRISLSCSGFRIPNSPARYERLKLPLI